MSPIATRGKEGSKPKRGSRHCQKMGQRAWQSRDSENVWTAYDVLRILTLYRYKVAVKKAVEQAHRVRLMHCKGKRRVWVREAEVRRASYYSVNNISKCLCLGVIQVVERRRCFCARSWQGYLRMERLQGQCSGEVKSSRNRYDDSWPRTSITRDYCNCRQVRQRWGSRSVLEGTWRQGKAQNVVISSIDTS